MVARDIENYSGPYSIFGSVRAIYGILGPFLYCNIASSQ